jgi:hypothetical protein
MRNRSTTSLRPALPKDRDALQLMGDFLSYNTYKYYERGLNDGRLSISQNERGSFTIETLDPDKDQLELNI